MDFLDPKKKQAHKIRLMVGYVLISVLIVLATVILLYQAYGYGLDKHGQIIQNGLVFVSSTPTPADIYLNGSFENAKTNTRLVLPAGQYTLKLTRSGYHSWQRSVGVEGGSVERFDYPFLFPAKLATTTTKAYAGQPALASQSPDRRWLLIEQPGSITNFDLFDLNNRQQSPGAISLPTGLVNSEAPAQAWQPIEWAADNRHLLLLHTFQGGSDYILLDRETPSNSLNLTQTLKLAPTAQLTLNNKHFDQYYLYDSAAAALGTLTLNVPTLQPVLTRVLAFKAYASNVVLFATDSGAPTGQAYIKILQDGKIYQIRTVASGSNYLLNLARYKGYWYMSAGVGSEGRLYIYKNPVQRLVANPKQTLVPASILKVIQPDTLSFSSSARFIAAESGAAFAVYDAENDKTYNYQLNVSVSNGQHASWMDGNHLIVTSGDRLVVFDYDDTNQQVLNGAVPGSLPYFDRDYKWLYNLALTGTNPPVALTSTALRISTDQ